MQRLADLTGLPVRRPKITETTALGVAFLAGLQVGLYEDLSDIGEIWQQDALCAPKMPDADRDRYYRGWQAALARVKGTPQ